MGVTVRRRTSQLDTWDAISGDTRWVDYSHQFDGDDLVVYLHTFRRTRERADQANDLLWWKPSTTVYGVGRGTFAEYAVVREDRLTHKPARLSFEEAAVVPISGATALQALTDHGRLESGQRVLVLGASGGVGSYAVQIAKALGAEVTGVASTAKVDLVRSLGADHVVDYTREDFAASGQRYDLILDIAGNPTLRRLRRALTPTGTAVIVGGEAGGDLAGGMNRTLRALVLSPFIGQRFANFINKERGSDLDRLTAFIDAGQVRPNLDRTYPLEQAPEAMHRLAAGQVRGKVAITNA